MNQMGGGGGVLSLKHGEENAFRNIRNAASDVRNVADLSTFHVTQHQVNSSVIISITDAV
jgi:hypothetical protein